MAAASKTAKGKQKAEETTIEEQTLEEVFGELDQIMAKLEGDQISLETSFQLYHQGMNLLKVCNDKIDAVEKKMLLLDEDGEKHEF